MGNWKNKRPNWCPHQDCIFKMSSQNLICTGKLPKPESHGIDENTHRQCLDERGFNKGIHDLQINKTDAWIFKRHMDLVINDKL